MNHPRLSCTEPVTLRYMFLGPLTSDVSGRWRYICEEYLTQRNVTINEFIERREDPFKRFRHLLLRQLSSYLFFPFLYFLWKSTPFCTLDTKNHENFPHRSCTVTWGNSVSDEVFWRLYWARLEQGIESSISYLLQIRFLRYQNFLNFEKKLLSAYPINHPYQE